MAVSTWGYKNTNGPATWAVDFPLAAGNKQSPVDIQTMKAVYDSDLVRPDKGLKISYEQEDDLIAENNGLSFKINIKRKSVLSGGPLKENETYRLEQFHLHWGSHDKQGSEHTINGQSYAAELHLVHYNTKYLTFKDAADKQDGLAVLGVMIEVGSEQNKGFKVVSEIAKSIKSKPMGLVDTKFNPDCLLPKNKKDYWTYPGSLTTPPCYESVQWIVFKEPVQYSPQQLMSLRNMLDANGQNIQDNYRPPLPIGDRKIKCNFKK